MNRRLPNPRLWRGEHSQLCWIEHDECALKAALSYLGARVEHDRARMALLRSALNLGPAMALREEAVELARDQIRQNHDRDWSPPASA